jgi:hypothetical protein
MPSFKEKGYTNFSLCLMKKTNSMNILVADHGIKINYHKGKGKNMVKFSKLY